MAKDFVRVKDPDTKHESTVTRAFADAHDLEILEDKEATDNRGRPLPGKPHVEIAKADKKPAGDISNTGGGSQSADARNAASQQKAGN